MKIKKQYLKDAAKNVLFGVFLGCVFFGIMFFLAEPHLDKSGVCCQKKIVETQNKQSAKPPKVVLEVVDQKRKIYVGEFLLTAYCGENYEHVCNDGDATRTATGTKPKQGRTIAVDPDVIEYGTKVIIDGNVYVAEDCGGLIKGNRIDLFFDSHQQAVDFGVQHANVYIEVEI